MKKQDGAVGGKIDGSQGGRAQESRLFETLV